MSAETEVSPVAAVAAPSAAEGEPPRRRRWPIVALIVIVVGAIAAAVAWLRHEEQVLLAAADAERAALEEQLATLTRKLDDAAAQRSQLEATMGVLAARTDALAAVVARLDESAQSAQREATLRDVEDLIIGAAERLRLGAEVGAAIAAIEAADRRVAELGEPALLPLRELLRRDLADLRAVPVPDIAGIALELAQYAERVDELPLKVVDFAPTEPAAEVAEPAATGWRGLAGRIWHDLVDLVDVRRIPTPDLVLTDPQLRRLLVENVRMELATARYATLRRDGANLRAAAGMARKLIVQYFDRDAASVAAVLDALARVQQIDLAPALPTLDEASSAIRALRETGPEPVEAALQ